MEARHRPPPPPGPLQPLSSESAPVTSSMGTGSLSSGMKGLKRGSWFFFFVRAM